MYADVNTWINLVNVFNNCPQLRVTVLILVTALHSITVY